MSKESSRILDSRLVVAICLILVGVLMLLDRFGGNLGFQVWDLWPLLLVIPGLFHLLQPRETRQEIPGIILLAVGGFFLLRNLEVIPRFHLEWDDIWPFIILVVGLVILWNALRGSRTAMPLDKDVINLSVFMGGGKHAFKSAKLKGGRVSAVMGGFEIDLRGCGMAADTITLDVFALMGGLEFHVPPEWEVVLKGTPLLGGIEYKPPHPDPGKRTGTLVVRGMAIMGGVEVKA